MVERLQEQMSADREMVSSMNLEGLEAQVLRAVSTCEALAQVSFAVKHLPGQIIFHSSLPPRTFTLPPPPLPPTPIGECIILVRK